MYLTFAPGSDNIKHLLLFPSDFRGIFYSGSQNPHSFSRSFRPVYRAARIFMAFCYMNFLREPLKIFSSVICFIFIKMVNNFGKWRFFKPTNCNHAMKQIMTHGEIAIGPYMRFERRQLSKNFPASGHGKQRVEEPKLDFVHKNADHIVPFWMNQTMGRLYHVYKE